MNAATKILLLLLLLGATAAGLVVMLSDQGEQAPPTVPRMDASAPDEAEPPAAQLQANEPPLQEPVRTPTRREIEAQPAATDAAQGVRGFVAAPGGGVPPATRVYLMEAAGADLFQQLRLANKGIRVPPLASTETDAQGGFALGVENFDASKRYEVRIVSDVFVDKSLPPITLREGQWYDAKRIELERGTTLYGRVTIAGSGGLPVPDAKVYVKPNTFFPSISPTPGREEGLEIAVDHTGGFRIDNAPSGIANLSAVAPGYARIEIPNKPLDAKSDNQVLFELPTGVAIAGVVTDSEFKPVKGVRIEATSISAKSPSGGRTHSSSDGSFEVLGLIEGPYMITAVAPGYVRVQTKNVQAPDPELQIVLEKQGEAGVRVFDKDNRLLRTFTLTVKTYTEGQEMFGNTDVPRQKVRTNSNGVATVSGLDPASYVFQVEAPGHCKAYSDPFTIALGGEKPIVEVRMNQGGILTGTVLDTGGQPVANVRVQTMANHIDENPFTNIFKGIIPFKITRKSVVTDQQGRYRLNLLTPGTYQLKFAHPQYYEVFLKDNVVEASRTTALDALTMERGTLVQGEVRLDGVPAGQVKVTISSAADPDNPTPPLFSSEAITDNEGRYQLPKRVPPGRYTVMAARQTLGNPLLQIADFHKSKKEITLGRGQEKFFLPIALTK